MDKFKRLRCAARERCRDCATALEAGTRAVSERDVKTVCCLECAEAE